MSAWSVRAIAADDGPQCVADEEGSMGEYDGAELAPEARLFCRQARRRFVPSMRQRIDPASLYGDALAALPDAMDGQLPLPVPDACPAMPSELPTEAWGSRRPGSHSSDTFLRFTCRIR
jgi:hypothetical protein